MDEPDPPPAGSPRRRGRDVDPAGPVEAAVVPSLARPPSLRSRLLRLLVLVVLLVQVVVPLLLYVARNRILFFPRAEPQVAQAPALFERCTATLLDVRPGGDDGEPLRALDVRPPGTDERSPTLLFLHGNAGNAAGRAGTIDRLAETTGLRVVLHEYAGFGGNPGSPTAKGIGREALAAFDAIVTGGTPPGRIVVYGESIGGAAAMVVATERTPGGLITQSTFSSLRSMARRQMRWLPLVPALVGDLLDSASRAPDVACPWLLVHGTRDRIVPFEEARLLAAAATGAVVPQVHPLERVGHNDVFHTGGGDYAALLEANVREWTEQPRDAEDR